MSQAHLSCARSPSQAVHAAAALIIVAASVGATHADECTPHWQSGVGFDEIGSILAFATLSHPMGATIYASGNSGIAEWGGTEWSVLGVDALFEIRALAIFDDGAGAALYATPEGGFLPDGQTTGVIKWDGAWQNLGSGLSGPGLCVTLAVFDDGSGAGDALYAGGIFSAAGGAAAANIARWDGLAWSPVGGAPNGLSSTFIRSMAVFDDGNGAALYVGANLLAVDGVPTSLAKWDGAKWAAVLGAPQGEQFVVTAMTVHDDGRGPALYVGGFTSVMPFPFPVVQRFDGIEWSTVGTPLNGSLTALASFDDGTGEGAALYVSGPASAETERGSVPLGGIGRLHNGTWAPLGNGVSSTAIALLPTTDLVGHAAPALLVGGSFLTASGLNSPRIAQWTGCAAPVSADLNGDGLVDGADLGILLSQWGTDGGADLNGDGVVDGADLGLLLAAWSE